ncbi:ribonucleotide-diphosphate reductase subunit beta, partial [Streptomyces asiaticus]
MAAPVKWCSQFYDRYRDAIKNTWTVEEVDLHSDVADLAKL